MVSPPVLGGDEDDDNDDYLDQKTDYCLSWFAPDVAGSLHVFDCFCFDLFRHWYESL